MIGITTSLLEIEPLPKGLIDGERWSSEAHPNLEWAEGKSG